MPRRQDKLETESSRRLLRAAVELIGEQGYERTTVAEIGARAGYSRPMVRARYGSKQALLESILRSEYNSRLFAALQVPAGSSGRDELLARVDRLVALGQELPELMRSFLVLSFEAVAPVRELQPWMRELLRRYVADVREALERGVRDGSVASHIESQVAARRLVAEGIGHAYLALIDPDEGGFVDRTRMWRRELAAELAGEPAGATEGGERR